MKDIIKTYIISEYGEKITNLPRKKHYSYCSFPEGDCSCKDLKDIDYNTELITGGYIDSFSMVNVLIFIEETFKVKIPNVKATPSNFNTINNITKLVEDCK